MFWNAPEEGQQRVVNRFAWLPVELEDGTVIWLERYRRLEEWKSGFFSPHTWDTLRTFQ